MNRKWPFIGPEFEALARWYFGTAAVLLLLRFASNVLFSQMGNPVLAETGTDHLYIWLFKWGITKWCISGVFTPALLDILLFALLLVGALSPSWRWLSTLFFSTLLTIYMVAFNTYAGHHYHGLFFIILGSTPFWWRNAASQQRAIAFVRYYFLFVFVSACCWKFFRGALFQPDQMVNILRAQHAQSFLEGDWLASSRSWLLVHPALAQMLLISGAAIQGFFVIGFFSRSWDRVLVFLAFLFALVNYWLMGIFMAEVLTGCLFLLYQPAGAGEE
ncbi:MAG: hypothetical protein U0T84_10205 [Chitinophagales bacterium]